MGKNLENMSLYTYTALDGTVITLRQMSQQERETLFFNTKRWNWLCRAFGASYEQYDDELFAKAFAKLYKLLQALCQGDSLKSVRKWGDSLNGPDDVSGVMTRIQEVELALHNGDDVPEQDNLIPAEDEVESAAPAKLEQMGEDSPAGDHTPTT